jgi:hypothetical protein
MGSRNAYKDMLDNVVSPITCVSMNHQNQLEQMANGAMFATHFRCKFATFTPPSKHPRGKVNSPLGIEEDCFSHFKKRK